MAKLLTFNNAVYLPPVLRDRLPQDFLPIKWSDHALNAAVQDDFYEAPGGSDDVLDMTIANVVEVVATPDLTPCRMIVRVPYDNYRDAVMALAKTAYGGTWEVTTCWANTVDDHHKTLNRARCVSPPVLALA